MAVHDGGDSHAHPDNRRYARDPEYRAICEDYAVATRALEYWQNDHSKAEDDGQLIRELEYEILEHLTGQQGTPG